MTKTRLVNTMSELFKKHPLEEIKITDICKEAGVSVGTFYHYYRSKADYFHEVMQEDDTAALKEWEHYKNMYKNPADAIRFLTVASIRDVTENGPVYATSLYRFMLYPDYESSAMNDPQRVMEMRKTILDRDKGYRGIIKGQMELLAEQGRLCGEVSAVFESLMDIMTGTIYNWCYRDGEYDIVDRLNRLLDAFLSYYTR